VFVSIEFTRGLKIVALPVKESPTNCELEDDVCARDTLANSNHIAAASVRHVHF
jgi:hypothetical protein